MADIEIHVDVSGIDRILATEPGRVETWLDGFAEDMVTQIKLSMGTSPPGRTYQRGKNRTHVASVEGFPPNIDMGTLINSIRQEPTGRLERTISDGVEYGIWLEDGTERMGPRPFMRPVFDDAAGRMENDARAKLNLER